MRSLLIFCCALYSLFASQSVAATYPKLNNNFDDAICAQALNVARIVFESHVEDVSVIPKLPSEVGAEIVWQKDDFNETFFIHKIEETQQTYTQKAMEYGHKWLIVQEPFNWRGDLYSLYAAPPNTLTAPLVDAAWASPIIFRTTEGHTFAVHPGVIWSFLPDWHVFVLSDDGGKDVCTIAFRPDVDKATSLLPLSVKVWASLLDSTLGNGQNEGTANYTARIRSDVQKVWANVALRPWVTYRDIYNTREEVDKGLKKWSLVAKSFAAVYIKIEAGYPAAEDALAQYYQTNFGMAADEAHRMAKSALDIAYRSYFVFPKAQD